MAAQQKATRILLWSLAIAAMAGTFALLAARQSRLPPITEAPVCEALPPNIKKLSPALASQHAAAAIEEYGQDWATLKAAIRPGDTVHEFETGVTGGHLVMRGGCFIGQAVTWIR